MATTTKALFRGAATTTLTTTLYTVPAATQAVISTIVIANQTATAATFRISVRPAGAAQTAAMYLAYDVTVGASDSTALTLGITMGATDVLTVYGSTATLSFTAFGSEIA